MDKITLTVPALYADHHVIVVKRLLSPLPGVENVVVSSAFKELAIEFDAAKTSADVLVKTLTAAGYAPGLEPVVERTPDATPDPAWEALGIRTTVTNPVDLRLSGEFRQY
ncbi:MAG: heavy-metal-associated domain-containing protein [Chloroflexi bacterium]|nr:heavy-metal-associated domain-containing protein [Chloroflexota bacterium]